MYTIKLKTITICPTFPCSMNTGTHLRFVITILQRIFR